MGRFLLGFAIGAAVGAAAVIFTAPRSGDATRQGIRGTFDDTRQNIRGTFDDTRQNIRGLIGDTLGVARQASAAREQELWADFRARLANKTS